MLPGRWGEEETAYRPLLTEKTYKAHSSHLAQAPRNFLRVSSSNSASCRSRLSLSWMAFTSLGFRKGNLALLTLSGKSTMRRRPRKARNMVMQPLMMKILCYQLAMCMVLGIHPRTVNTISSPCSHAFRVAA